MFHKLDDRNQSLGYQQIGKGYVQKIKTNNQQQKYAMIENYYGAHKNFKTDFKNKKYRNVYNQLIISRPSQPQHKPLYYQDMLTSIIKTVQSSFMGKDNMIQSIVPFMNIGTRIIIEFYWLFLRERRVIDHQLTIDPIMKNKITNFLTLIIDFSSKVAQYMAASGNQKNSGQIFQKCYKNIVLHVLNSSTSNILLLKKCGQFLLHYALHSLNMKNNEKAHQLLQNGLKTQLNLLILIKYNINNKKNSKKFIKKYSSALKSLIHIYIALAIFYQRMNNIYQCSTLIMQAILIEDLIYTYNNKSKKWVWNLQQFYSEQKNKHLQLQRICNTFFNKQILKQSNSQTIKYFSNELQQMDTLNFLKVQRPLTINKNFEYFQDKNKQINKQNNSDTNNKKNQQMKTYKQKIVKQVRFKLSAEQSQYNSFKKDQMKKKQFCQNNQVDLNDILKFNLPFNDNEHQYPSNQLIQLQFGKNKKEYNFENKIKNSNSNDILLFGQNFWQFQEKNVKRSKSNFQKISKRQYYQIRKSGRKLSQSNMNYLEVKVGQKGKIRNITSYLKEGFNKSGLKKKTKDKGIFLQKKNQTPENFNVMSKKFSDWHQKSTAIGTDTIIKKHKLKQRKNPKNIFEVCFSKQQMETQLSMQQQNKQLAVSKIESELENKKSKENNAKVKKPNGVKLFKQYLLDNKNYFNITKTQLFNSSFDLQSQKRFLSFLIAQKPQKVEKYFQKNHWQAKQNVQFFLKEIQSSNKKLMQLESKKLRSLTQIKKNLQPTTQYIQAQKVLNIQNIPKNLFSTSIKSRVNQMIKYF